MPNPVVHFEITGKDAKKLGHYYSSLFAWNVNADNPMNYGIVEAGERGIGGGIGQSEDGNSLVTFYVEVDDPQKYLDKAVALGGKVVMPVTEIPDVVTIAQFADPDGNVIGILKSA